MAVAGVISEWTCVLYSLNAENELNLKANIIELHSGHSNRQCLSAMHELPARRCVSSLAGADFWRTALTDRPAELVNLYTLWGRKLFLLPVTYFPTNIVYLFTLRVTSTKILRHQIKSMDFYHFNIFAMKFA